MLFAMRKQKFLTLPHSSSTAAHKDEFTPVDSVGNNSPNGGLNLHLYHVNPIL